uniref:Uncharacterized protein n=1 Tax=Arundo donax TaxID=35708 RepID=A0A0A9CDI6_ARUDO
MEVQRRLHEQVEVTLTVVLLFSSV